MDLSKFKVVSDTDDSYHLMHPSGKKFHVEKSKLNEKSHAAIKKYCMGGGVQKFADGGQALADPTPAAPAWSPEALGLTNSVPDTPTDPQQQLTNSYPDPAQALTQSMQAQQTPDASQQQPQQSAQPQDPMAQKVQGQQDAFDKEKAANSNAAKAQIGQGNQEAQAFKDYDVEMRSLPRQEDIVDHYKIADDELKEAYMNKKIDPDRLWKNASVPSKIGAMFGMILSGAGGGAAKQTPMAQQMIGDMINRDIDAQKNEQGKAMNMWKMNREALGTELGANLATQNQLLNGVKMKLMQASSQFKGPMAMANAQALNAKIDQEQMMNRIKLSMMQGPTQEAPSPEARVQWLVPPQHQAKVFGEIDSAKAAAEKGPEIMKAFDSAANNIHGADFVPGMQNADQKQLHVLLGPTFQDVEGTVRQAAMDNMFQNSLPQFGDSQETIMKKRAGLDSYLRSKESAATAKGFGIDLKRFPSTSWKTQPMQGAAPEVRYDAQGNPFVKGPDGKPVPYKK